MKQLKRVAALVSAVSLLFTDMAATTSPVFALKGDPYTSGIQVRNLESYGMQVVLSFYQLGNSIAVKYAYSFIDANSSLTYYPLSSIGLGTFNGSAVVSAPSGGRVAVIVNEVSNSLNSFASYTSIRNGATSVSLPLLMRNNSGYDTWFKVQNGGAEATNVTIVYSNGCTRYAYVLPYGSAIVDQQTETCLPNGFVGSAQVTSAQPLAVVVEEVGPNNVGLFSYDGAVATSPYPTFPIFSNNYRDGGLNPTAYPAGSGTGIQLQNTGASATDVTITYTPYPGYPGTACNETIYNIGSNQSVTFGYPNMPSGCGTQFVGSARVTYNRANTLLMGITNQVMRNTSHGSAYLAFVPAVGTKNVSLPLVMDRNSGYYTNISVMNAGAFFTNVTCTLSGGGGSWTWFSIPPAEGRMASQFNAVGFGYVGSAVCTASTGDERIIAIVNEWQSNPAGNSDALLTYEGFNY